MDTVKLSPLFWRRLSNALFAKTCIPPFIGEIILQSSDLGSTEENPTPPTRLFLYLSYSKLSVTESRPAGSTRHEWRWGRSWTQSQSRRTRYHPVAMACALNEALLLLQVGTYLGYRAMHHELYIRHERGI